MASRIFSPERFGSSSNPSSPHTHLCRSVKRTVLGSTSGYFSASSIEAIGEAFARALNAVLEHTSGKEMAELTPSDIDYKGFDAQQLDTFLDLLDS